MAALTMKFEHHYAARSESLSFRRPDDETAQAPSMSSEADPLAEFRRLVNRRARQFPRQWEDSKQLIEQSAFPSTVARLLRLSQERELPAAIKEALRGVFGQQLIPGVQDLNGKSLKALTGFPPAKALRALCVFFELIAHPGSQWPTPAMTSEEIEQRVRRTPNPFDLLLHADVASVLDLGAGDLSFAGELADLYVPELRRQNRRLVLHCLDRLHPRSQLGGPLHPEQNRLAALQAKLGPTFAFFGNQDMFDLRDLDEHGKLAPRYTIATCWAPATPTFAYEPARLSQSVIAEDLRRTKGSFRHTRFQGESALEVRHGERTLLFPSWKFEIVGPLALLSLLAQRGSLCVLGAVDAQVFWELLAQLLDDPRYRPQDRPFTSENLPEIFGEIYRALDRLPIGDSIELADIGTLRRRLPPADPSTPARRLSDSSRNSFRYILLTRGATFPDIPASSTARKFSAMAEEAPPWFLTLVPT